MIAYEYEQRTQPFLTEKTWFFQSNIPHLAQTFTLELPPGFTYGEVVQDAVRINLPTGLIIESLPQKDHKQFQQFAAYNYSSESAASNFTIRRDFVLGNVIYLPKAYPDLRTFYNQFETKDQENVVLRRGSPTPSSARSGE